MRNVAICTFLVVSALIGIPQVRGDATPAGTQYLLYEMYGGTWCDAEKTSDNGEDDLLCWAAQTANMLTWTGFGAISGLSNTDEIFAFYQDHWTDVGGSCVYGLEWWLNGENDAQGQSGWSQVDDPIDGFYPEENIWDYLHYSGYDPDAMDNVDTYITSGWATGLNIKSSTVSHAITCWGFNVDPNDSDNYLGVWVTDSDDDKYGIAPRPDVLHYYEVDFHNNAWYLQDYDNCDTIYITEVVGMEQCPFPAPEPTTISLLLLGGVAMLRKRRK